jgi:hypothetical protein
MEVKQYFSPQPSWAAIRPYKSEESNPRVTNIESEQQIVEELLNILLQINSPFIQFRSVYRLKQSNASAYFPSVIEFHQALKQAEGLVRKICGDLSDSQLGNSNSIPSHSIVLSWAELWQACYDLDRYGSYTISRQGPGPLDRSNASLTAQALSFALSQFLDEHYQFVLRLETKIRNTEPAFGLQEFWFHLQSVLHTHQLLASLIRELYILTENQAVSYQKSLKQGASIINNLTSAYQSLSG